MSPFTQLLLNLISGMLTFYITKFFDTHGMQVISIIVFVLYIAFILFVIFVHTKKAIKPSLGILNKTFKKPSNYQKNPDSDETINHILTSIVKLSALRHETSPKTIGRDLGINPEFILTHLKQMQTDLLVVFINGGKPPDLETSFFITENQAAWKKIKFN